MSNIKINFIYNVIYQLLLIVLPLITTPYISRVLGAEKIGIYSYTFSVANYFVLFAMLGVKKYGNRSIAIVRDNKNKMSETFWSIYVFQLLTSTIMILFYIIYLFIFSKEYFFIGLLQLIFVFSAMVDISWFYFGIERFKITVTRGMIIRILSVISIFTFVKSSDDLWKYVIIMAGSILCTELALWPTLTKFIVLKRPTIKDVLRHVKPNIILFIPVLAVSVYLILGKVMLGALSNMSELGHFELTERIIGVPFGIITALGTVMLPRMSNLIAKGDIALGFSYIEISMKFILFLSSAMTFGLASISSVIGPVFLGKEFTEIGLLITLISPVILIKAWANVIRTQYLIPSMQDKKYISSVVIGAIVSVMLNLILIKPYGAIGATFALLGAETAVAITQTISVRKELDIKLYLKNGVYFIFFGFVMYTIVKLCENFLEPSVFTLLFLIVLGGFIYLFLCAVYFLYTKDQMFINYINKIKLLIKN